MIKKNQNIATILLIEGVLSLLIGLGFGFAVLLADRHENAGKLVVLSVVFIFAGIGFLAYRFYSFIWPEQQAELKSQTAQRLREQMKEYDNNMVSAPPATMLSFWERSTGSRRVLVPMTGALVIFLFLVLFAWRGFLSSGRGPDRGATTVASAAVSSAPMTLRKTPGIRPDTAWQEPFDFPGSNKRMEGYKLTFAFPLPMVDREANITLDGKFYLNEMATLALASTHPLQFDILSYGTGVTGKVARVGLGLKRASAVAEYLVSRGIPPANIIIRSSDAMPDELNYSQVVRVSVLKRTTEYNN